MAMRVPPRGLDCPSSNSALSAELLPADCAWERGTREQTGVPYAPSAAFLEPLEDRGNPHAAANAQGGEAVARLTSRELVQQLDRQHRPARTDRVAQRD